MHLRGSRECSQAYAGALGAAEVAVVDAAQVAAGEAADSAVVCSVCACVASGYRVFVYACVMSQ